MRADELRRRMDGLPAGLLRHVDRVVAEAARLAEAHDVDHDRVALAAQGHDIARGLSPNDLLRLAADFRLDVTDIDRASPVMLHGPVGAALLAREHGIDDEAALAAARYHTTAFAGLGAIERIIFVADKVEPRKRRRDRELQRIRELAAHDLDAATRALLDLLTARAVERGWALHPWLVDARNALILRGEASEIPGS